MTISVTARLLALSAAYLVGSTAWAQGGAIPAPELKAKEISGLLDIDFRCEIPSVEAEDSYFAAYGYCKPFEPSDIIKVTTTSGTRTQNEICLDNPSDQSTRQDGYGIKTVTTGRTTCDDGIGKGESLTVSITSKGQGTAAFDVNGVWLTDFRRDKAGESGAITLTLAGSNPRTFSFNWKDVRSEDISDANPNDEFFVGFGETLRMTKAVISGNVGSFSVAGFSQQPIDIKTTDSLCGESCNPELARNVRLELEPVDPSTLKAGRKGVTGTLFKEGVYVIKDPRGYCNGGAVTELDPVRTLPISITGRIDGTTLESIPDLVMLPHQCGHPTADSPNLPVIYVLDLDGSSLTIAEDTITAIFDDDSDNSNIENTYFCTAPDRAFRPGIGWLPKNQSAATPYTEIPVFDAAGKVVPFVQDVTVGPCGSSRGSVPRYSYVVYNWVNRVDAAGTSYDAVISARIEQLGAYVNSLFPCVDQGVNQSTLSSDVGRIRQSFAGQRYTRALQYVAEMRADVLNPPLLSDIEEGQCFFDLVNGAYGPTGTLPANAVGSLLVQLDHLDWMIRTTIIAPDTVPPQSN